MKRARERRNPKFVTDPALPPGRYTLVAGPERGAQQPFPIVVVANEITPLVIQLDGE